MMKQFKEEINLKNNESIRIVKQFGKEINPKNNETIWRRNNLNN
jgi:uncharacterized protein YneR